MSVAPGVVAALERMRRRDLPADDLSWVCYQPRAAKAPLWHLADDELGTVCGVQLRGDRVIQGATRRVCQMCGGYARRRNLTGPRAGRTPHARS